MPEFTGYPARNGRPVYPRRQPRSQSWSPELTLQVLQLAPTVENFPRDWVRTPLTYTGLLSTRSAQFPLPAPLWPPIGNGTGGNKFCANWNRPNCPRGGKYSGTGEIGKFDITRFVSPENNTLRHQIEALDDDAREFFEERAGIHEYDAGYSRSQAEALAWEDVQRYLTLRDGTQPQLRPLAFPVRLPTLWDPG